MYYRDLTRAAPIVQREIDLVHTAAAGDALTVYLWRLNRSRHITKPPASSEVLHAK